MSADVAGVDPELVGVAPEVADAETDDALGREMRMIAPSNPPMTAP
jgi:hypothetical protein